MLNPSVLRGGRYLRSFSKLNISPLKGGGWCFGSGRSLGTLRYAQKLNKEKCVKLMQKSWLHWHCVQASNPSHHGVGAIHRFCQSIRGPLTIKNRCFKQIPHNYARPLFVQFVKLVWVAVAEFTMFQSISVRLLFSLPRARCGGANTGGATLSRLV